MSHDIEWLKGAQENFANAIADGDIALAKAVIADTFDAGFPTEARSMNLQLREATTHEDL